MTRIGLRATPYFGEKFDNNLITLVPKRSCDLDALWNYCRSGDYKEAIRELDQKLSLTNATACKVSVDLTEWAGKEQLPKPYSRDPAQWLFHGYPVDGNDPLQTAVARLLGYRWPAELDLEMELAEEQRALIPRCMELAGHVDDDGIVCLPPVRGEKSADQRLEALLQDAYGAEWTTPLKNRLLENVGSKSLSLWLRDKFLSSTASCFKVDLSFGTYGMV